MRAFLEKVSIVVLIVGTIALLNWLFPEEPSAVTAPATADEAAAAPEEPAPE